MHIFVLRMKKGFIIVAYWLAAIILTATILMSLDYDISHAVIMSLSFLPAAMALSFFLPKVEKTQEKKGGKGKDQGKKGKKEKEGEKKDEGKKEEDDLDLFGEENEDDIKAKEEMKKKNKDKKKDKKKPVDKSHVILEIKGWEEGQDLEALAKKIISTIKKDGLQWNTGYKLEDVAFGIKKLVIAFLAEDDKCSVQEIQDELESWKDDIQSVDIVSFNKS